MRPVSVATMTLRASVAAARRNMPDVDRTWVRPAGSTPVEAIHSAWEAQPHSGWIISSASGNSARRASRSAGSMPACTWHSPIHTSSLRPVWRSTWAARNMSGRKRISLSAGIACTTWTALAEVQQ